MSIDLAGGGHGPMKHYYLILNHYNLILKAGVILCLVNVYRCLG